MIQIEWSLPTPPTKTKMAESSNDVSRMIPPHPRNQTLNGWVKELDRKNDASPPPQRNPNWLSQVITVYKKNDLSPAPQPNPKWLSQVVL